MSDNIVVFVGPTLAKSLAEQLLDATYLPPASQGEVYREARKRPIAIGIIDGYFEQVPAVWHKEILWAMAHGVHVFGASSMGALRAAELHTYGMRGCGEIWQAFKDGILQDDDEVTIVHGPPDSGYIKASEAMVNIRATLDKAEDQNILDRNVKEALVMLAKNTWYPERNFRALIQHLDEIDALASQNLKHWLVDNSVDRKALDAKVMLSEMNSFLSTNPQPAVANFHFEHTDAWEQVRREVDRRVYTSAAQESGTSLADGVRYEELLDELRLTPDTYRQTVQMALLRRMSRELSLGDGVQADGEQLTQVHNHFRQQRGLIEPADIQQWLIDNDLDPRHFTDLLEQLFHTNRMQKLVSADIDRDLRDQLILQGTYPEFMNRARQKHALLNDIGLENPGLDDSDIDEEQLWLWFVEERDGGKDVPKNLSQYAQQLGFFSKEQMRRVLIREYCYQKRAPKQSDN